MPLPLREGNLFPVRREEPIVRRPPPWRDPLELHHGHFQYAVELVHVDESLGLSCQCGELGCVVVGIDDASPSAHSGLSVGMRLVSIHGHRIFNENDLVTARQLAARDRALAVMVVAVRSHLRATSPTPHTAHHQVSYRVTDAVAIRTIPHRVPGRAAPPAPLPFHFEHPGLPASPAASRLRPGSPRLVVYNTDYDDYGPSIAPRRGAAAPPLRSPRSPGSPGGFVGPARNSVPAVHFPQGYSGRPVPGTRSGYTGAGVGDAEVGGWDGGGGVPRQPMSPGAVGGFVSPRWRGGLYEARHGQEDPFPALQAGLPPELKRP